MAGKTVKIVVTPKWKVSYVKIFDVQVSYCCTQSNFSHSPLLSSIDVFYPGAIV